MAKAIIGPLGRGQLPTLVCLPSQDILAGECLILPHPLRTALRFLLPEGATIIGSPATLPLGNDLSTNQTKSPPVIFPETEEFSAAKIGPADADIQLGG